ncbi:MAG TPA: class I SAM-dependent methyltransferase [Bryobacteraceae bacterium]|jgi:SAM-dependent methyltransferase
MLKNAQRFVRGLAQKAGFDIVHYLPVRHGPIVPVRPEFKGLAFAGAAAQKLLDDFSFDTVLDIGCGAGEQSEVFLKHGKTVTALDYGKSIYFEKNQHRMQCLIGDFNTMPFDKQFDCVWASHVLEHQLNPGMFLSKIFEVTKEGGVVCLTVPPLQKEILGGHVSFWNAGLLLYHLVLAGFDCREVSILHYGYNISVIVRKKAAKLPELAFDNGDVRRILPFLPEGFYEGFNGDIASHNW